MAGRLSDPVERGPLLDGERGAVAGQLALYRRAAGPGVYLLLEGSSIDVIRDRVDTLPFVVEGLMTLDYDEIYEI
jgi:hypothetical protein